MENLAGFDRRAQMVKELLEGFETAKQLRKQMLSSPTTSNHTSSHDQALNHSLIEKMLSSFDKTIEMAKLMGIELPHQEQPSNMDTNTTTNNNNSNYIQTESPHSLSLGSPISENSHQDRHVSKKRKVMTRWSKQIQVRPGVKISGLVGPLDDGFSWRKYGQKEILGAKFPRGYYRCTHKHTQGCEATKHVQQSDQNPSIYNVIYRGEHTCIQRAHSQHAQPKPNPAQIKAAPQPQPQPQPLSLPTPQQHTEVYLGLGPNGDLKVEQVDRKTEAHIFRSFSFTSALLENGPVDNYMLGFSPSFGLNVQTSESDLNEAKSGPSSVTNSPTDGGDFEFFLDPLLDIDPNFPFEF